MQTAEAKATSPAKISLLFIDDEPRVLKSMRAMFRRDFEVFLANSGEEALAIMAEEEIRVVVSDQRMPNMTGVEVLSEIKQRYPLVVRILLTGYADLQAIEDSLNEAEVFRYLMKPCPSEEIRGAIEAGLEISSPHQETPTAEVITLTIPGALGNQNYKSEPESNKTDAAATQNLQAVAVKPVAKRSSAALHIAVYGDEDLVQDIGSALPHHKVHHIRNMGELVHVSESNPLGVVVTDVPMDEVETLATRIDNELPHLVTVVASDRSDANTLIQLINSGPVYRFLLKPVQSGRLALTLNSAMERCTPRAEVSSTQSPATSRWQRFVAWAIGRTA